MSPRPQHPRRAADAPTEPGTAEALPAPPDAGTAGTVPARGGHGGRRPHRPRPDDAERRQEEAPRRRSRRGMGRRTDDQVLAADGRPQAAGERRRSRTLAEQRAQWAEVRRWVARAEVEPFRELLERLAQVAFGPAATVMPHLRRSRGRKYLAFVVDAACPEAGTNYADFLPLERAFWTAYATVPKPAASFMVAVRPARGWCRSEALMPLFTQFTTPELSA